MILAYGIIDIRWSYILQNYIIITLWERKIIGKNIKIFLNNKE